MCGISGIISYTYDKDLRYILNESFENIYFNIERKKMLLTLLNNIPENEEFFIQNQLIDLSRKKWCRH